MKKLHATSTENLLPQLSPDFETASGELPHTLLNDLMFRIVFESNPDGLKKLLCSLLHIDESEITDIEINSPFLLGNQLTDKYFILDLNLLMNSEKRVHLELQVIAKKYWTNRSLCYLCENFNHLNSGEDYYKLKSLIQIDLLDFDLYKDSKEFYSVYHLANDKNHRIYSDKLALHVLELSKEEYATEEDKSYGIDYWARLFKSTTWEELKKLAQEHQILQSTVETIYRVNADNLTRAKILEHERFLRDQLTDQHEKELLNAEIESLGIKLENMNTELANTSAELDCKKAELDSKKAELDCKNAELDCKKQEIQEAHQKFINKIRQKIAKNKSLEQIADELEEDIESIRPLYDELRKLQE